MRKSTAAIVKKYLPKTYAIKFNPKFESSGVYLLILSNRSSLIGLKHGIFIVTCDSLNILDKEKIKYKRFEVKPGPVDEIMKKAKRKGWVNQRD